MTRKIKRTLAWLFLGLASILGAPGGRSRPDGAADGSAATEESRRPATSSGQAPVSGPGTGDRVGTISSIALPSSSVGSEGSPQVHAGVASLQETSHSSDAPSTSQVFQNMGNPAGGDEVPSEAFSDMLGQVFRALDSAYPQLGDYFETSHEQLEHPLPSVMLGMEPNASGGESISDTTAADELPLFGESFLSRSLRPDSSEMTSDQNPGMSEGFADVDQMYGQLLELEQSETPATETDESTQITQLPESGSDPGAVRIGSSTSSKSSQTWTRRPSGDNQVEDHGHHLDWTDLVPSLTLGPGGQADGSSQSLLPVPNTFASPVAERLSTSESLQSHQFPPGASGSEDPSMSPGLPVPKPPRRPSTKNASSLVLRKSIERLEERRAALLSEEFPPDASESERAKRQKKLYSLRYRIDLKKLRVLVGDAMAHQEASPSSRAPSYTITPGAISLKGALTAAEQGSMAPGIAYLSRWRERRANAARRLSAEQSHRPIDPRASRSNPSQSRNDGQGSAPLGPLERPVSLPDLGSSVDVLDHLPGRVRRSTRRPYSMRASVVDERKRRYRNIRQNKLMVASLIDQADKSQHQRLWKKFKEVSHKQWRGPALRHSGSADDALALLLARPYGIVNRQPV